MFSIKIAKALCDEYGIINWDLVKKIQATHANDFETDHEALTLVRNWFSGFDQVPLKQAA